MITASPSSSSSFMSNELCCIILFHESVDVKAQRCFAASSQRVVRFHCAGNTMKIWLFLLNAGARCQASSLHDKFSRCLLDTWQSPSRMPLWAVRKPINPWKILQTAKRESEDNKKAIQQLKTGVLGQRTDLMMSTRVNLQTYELIMNSQ